MGGCAGLWLLSEQRSEESGARQSGRSTDTNNLSERKKTSKRLQVNNIFALPVILTFFFLKEKIKCYKRLCNLVSLKKRCVCMGLGGIIHIVGISNSLLAFLSPYLGGFKVK